MPDLSMDTILQLNEFFVQGNNPNKSHVLLNITEPSTTEEKAKGYFFAICEIDNGDNDYIMKLQNIIDEIENNYYEVDGDEDRSSLEIVLNKINKQAFSILKSDKKLNCVIGAIRKSDIIFSFYGNPQILLFYKNKQGVYKKIDLVKENSDSEENDRALFSQIIQGKIGPDDYFFTASPRVSDYFSQDRLQKIISNRPPRQSADHLQRSLTELKNDLSFGGIIIHLQKYLEKSNNKTMKRPKKGSSARSLTGLFRTEEKTANILSPSFLPRIKKATQGQTLPETQSEVEYEEMRSRPATEINSAHLRSRPAGAGSNTETIKSKKDLQEILKTGLDLIWVGLKWLFRALVWLAIFLATIISKIGKGFVLLFMIAINYKNRRQTILNNWITAIKHHQKNIKNLPITVKILIILSLIITIILIGSIIYLRSQHKQEESKQIFNSTVQQIKDQRDTAEKTLIYNDTETAFSELQSAKTLLAKLDCVDKERQLTCQNLSKDLEKIIDKVRKLYTITPQLIDDWSKTDQQLKTNSLMQIDKKIIGFSNDSSQIIEYNLLDKTSKIVATNIGNNGFTTVAVPKENDYAIAVYDNNKMARYDAKKSIWEKIDIDYQNSNTSIAGAFVYSRRLYTLDSNNSQIYRHDAIPTGFGRGKEWITDNSALDLGKSIDLAIDGDLYTVTTDGKLYKFSAGVLQDFSIAGLDPVLDSASAIWTYYELNYIYILDTKNKRLIIINKLDGSLKKQLTAVEFVNPTDMVVDETNSTAYILDSNKLYKIDLGL